MSSELWGFASHEWLHKKRNSIIPIWPNDYSAYVCNEATRIRHITHITHKPWRLFSPCLKNLECLSGVVRTKSGNILAV